MTDQVDSVNIVLNDSGQIVSQVEFLPFGETWTHEGDKGHAAKYNSQELDKETGYYFFNARHYDPEICRFVTADTANDADVKDKSGRVVYSNTQGWNRYGYVKNNPIIYKDPTGHSSEHGEGSSVNPHIGGSGKNGSSFSDIVSSIKDFFTGRGSKESSETRGGNTSRGRETVERTVAPRSPNTPPSPQHNTGDLEFGSPISGMTKKSDFNTSTETPAGIKSSSFGMRRRNGQNEFHNGVDIAVPEKTTITSIEAGHADYGGGPDDINGYFTRVYHRNGTTSVYDHQNRESWQQGRDQYHGRYVAKGTPIGGVGDTGTSTATGAFHLHLMIFVNGTAVDPEPLIKRNLSD